MDGRRHRGEKDRSLPSGDRRGSDGPLARPEGPEFELPRSSGGTCAIADAVASTPATTVAGGGEKLEALRRFALDDRVNHLSTRGQAMLEFTEGRELPEGQTSAAPQDPESAHEGAAERGPTRLL